MIILVFLNTGVLSSFLFSIFLSKLFSVPSDFAITQDDYAVNFYSITIYDSLVTTFGSAIHTELFGTEWAFT